VGKWRRSSTCTLPEGAWRGELLAIAVATKDTLHMVPRTCLTRLEKRKIPSCDRNRTSGCPALDLANLVTALSWLSNVCCMAQKTNLLTVIFFSLLLDLSPLEPDSLHSSLFSYVTNVFSVKVSGKFFISLHKKGVCAF